MGERLDSFDNKPTAQVEDSQRLDSNSFSKLSQTQEGLISIPEDSLKEFLCKNEDNIEDVLYILKFISKTETFNEIHQSVKNREAKKLTELFSHVSTTPPTILETSTIDLNENGSFVAFLNKEEGRMDIAWKNSKSKDHFFNILLKKVRGQSIDYPDILRSAGGLGVFLDEETSLNVEFYGDASKKGEFKYAPGYLKMFEEDLKLFFMRKFGEDSVKIHF